MLNNTMMNMKNNMMNNKMTKAYDATIELNVKNLYL